MGSFVIKHKVGLKNNKTPKSVKDQIRHQKEKYINNFKLEPLRANKTLYKMIRKRPN